MSSSDEKSETGGSDKTPTPMGKSDVVRIHSTQPGHFALSSQGVYSFRCSFSLRAGQERRRCVFGWLRCTCSGCWRLQRQRWQPAGYRRKEVKSYSRYTLGKVMNRKQRALVNEDSLDVFRLSTCQVIQRWD